MTTLPIADQAFMVVGSWELNDLPFGEYLFDGRRRFV